MKTKRKRSIQNVPTNGDTCVEVSETVTSVRVTENTTISASRDWRGTACVGASAAGVCSRAPFG